MFKNIIRYTYINRVPISVGIICICALYLRMRHLYWHALWADEIFYLHPATRETFLEFLKEIPKVEFCSYLSGDLFLFYPFFKIFSYNKWGLAIPSIISTIAGFYILYLVCKRYFKTAWAYLVTFSIVCFNTTMIFHATEIRTYAILPTIALIAFYLFQKIADSGFKLGRLTRIWAIVLFVLIIWFHAYGILMYMCLLSFFLLSRYKDSNLKTYFKNMAFFTVIVLCIAMPLWLYSVFGPHLNSKMNLNTFDWFPNPIHNPLGFLKSVFCNLVGFKLLYFLLPGVIVPFTLFYKDKTEQLLFFFFVIIAPISFILFLDIMQSYWFAQRQFVWVMPLFAFFLGWCWDTFILYIKARLPVKNGR